MRYTAAGYAIHHASSVFWACFFERALLGRRAPAPSRVAATAAVTTIAAYFVDYRVVPQRLTPGFESRLPLQDRALVYAAFAVGLGLGACLRTRARRRARIDRDASGEGDTGGKGDRNDKGDRDASSAGAGDGSRAIET
jgi:hypothetical protein